MNKLHLLAMVAGLGVLIGGSPAWGQSCAAPGCNPTASDNAGNTAGGTYALGTITTGYQNTAFGYDALGTNTGGYSNTASGYGALFQNKTGSSNTAGGYHALSANGIGYGNTATGHEALETNTSGNRNTADGSDALFSSRTGSYNTASGYHALYNSTGSYNTALGYDAGQNVTAGNYDIDIGSPGAPTDTHTIRIGTEGTQTATYIAGISGTNAGTTAIEVFVNAGGQLGTVKSSARFKRDIRDMGESSSGLMKLRPVTFRYKEDPTGTIQYGLVAEEVARVYPELVTYGADGKVETVRYFELAGMLLNELQKQAIENARQAERIRKLESQRAAFEARLSALEQTTQARNGGRKLAAAFDR